MRHGKPRDGVPGTREPCRPAWAGAGGCRDAARCFTASRSFTHTRRPLSCGPAGHGTSPWFRGCGRVPFTKMHLPPARAPDHPALALPSGAAATRVGFACVAARLVPLHGPSPIQCAFPSILQAYAAVLPSTHTHRDPMPPAPKRRRAQGVALALQCRSCLHIGCGPAAMWLQDCTYPAAGVL